MLKRNNVWEYGEGMLQACISSIKFLIMPLVKREAESIFLQSVIFFAKIQN